MKILITGATGFLGQVLLKTMREKGFFTDHEIKVYVMKNDPYEKDIKNYPIQIIHGDITQAEQVDNAIKGNDLVIHLAGFISYWKKDLKKLNSINIKGVENIVNSCLTHKMNKLIHISSVGSVGFFKDGTPAKEGTPFNWPDNFYYMVTKHNGEMVVQEAIEKKGLNAVILNPASIMGPGDPNIRTPHNQLYSKVYSGKMIGSFSGGLAVVDVRDIASIILKNIHDDFPAGNYLLIGDNLLYPEVLKSMGKSAGKKVFPFKIPSFIFWIAGLLLEEISLLTKTPPLLTAAYGRLSGWKTYYSNEKSRKVFGHKYISFEKTIQDSCEYFENTFLNKRT